MCIRYSLSLSLSLSLARSLARSLALSLLKEKKERRPLSHTHSFSPLSLFSLLLTLLHTFLHAYEARLHFFFMMQFPRPPLPTIRSANADFTTQFSTHRQTRRSGIIIHTTPATSARAPTKTTRSDGMGSGGTLAKTFCKRREFLVIQSVVTCVVQYVINKGSGGTLAGVGGAGPALLT